MYILKRKRFPQKNQLNFLLNTSGQRKEDNSTLISQKSKENTTDTGFLF